MERVVMSIGQSTTIKGELTANEDLLIDGKVEGLIDANGQTLTIGPNATIKAQVLARNLVIEGTLHGDASATERVEIKTNGRVEGDVSAPRVCIADGAHFRGKIDMVSTKPGTNSTAKAAAIESVNQLLSA